MKLKNILRILSLLLLIMSSSCKKLVEIAPPITSITSTLVFSNDATATSALVGIYSRMMGGGGTFLNGFASGSTFSVSLLCELSADGLTNYNTTSSATNTVFYQNAVPNTTTFTWSEIYQYIYTCNVILENVPNNPALSTPVQTQLTAEAKFIRAFCYFYLTNLFGDVPLFTTSDYVPNSVASRTPQAAVYAQIIHDLSDAQSTLPADYSTSATQERIRPNRWAATALLARVYLYTGQWANAETQSSAIINNTLFSLPTIGSDALNGLNTIFLKNSTETIWALKPVVTGYNTWDVANYILPATGPVQGGTNDVALSSQLMSAFEAGDLRRTAWVGSVTTTGVTGQTYYYAYKYKVQTSTATVISEYNIVFRLAEQYLIRAEARSMQGNITMAATDLNRIRNGAGLGNTIANDQATMIAAILKEKRVEFFCEWGHRWLDLKRTKTVDQVMGVVTPLKGGAWNTGYQLYPIPQSERLSDPNLTQNPGYPDF